MDTALLEVFLEVARRESFTAAAGSLGYTQSAISRQIAALEASVGAPLFDRLPRGVRLTEEGRALVPHATAVVGRLRAAVADVRAVGTLGGGRLRLGAIPTADMVLMPRAIAAFRQAYPAVIVTHAEGLTRRLVADLREGDLDLAVIGTASPEPVFEGVRLRRLMDDALAVALPRGHRLADREMLSLADLEGENWIAGQPRSQDTLIASVQSGEFQPGIPFVVLEWSAKQGFVAAGLGITLIPALGAETVRPDVAVVALDPREVAPRSVFAATPEGVADSAPVTAFMELLKPGPAPAR
ncbi:LysR family transcriptional regulator [Catenulispora sp. NF23]|uniref:LysR family transcriptional regulator n=1 Tax=Catenulispora pinistramenti TaxID=2705254 RepID=UPI001BA68D10|nr:LysR family transcriptional regulator [Catenulispora pinistramenti]MBS2537737.1 LysR family transcriptional regulator [Catenulispora pinistramenti]